MVRGWHIAVLSLLCWLSPAVGAAPLKVAVLDDAPPLGYRDAAGQLTGFSVVLMQALCAEMAEPCEFEAVKLEHLVDDLAAGHFDVAAVGLIATPERRRKLVFTKPVYRSLTLFFARQGVRPEMPKVRIATFKGSAQEAYIRAQGWDMVGAQTDEQMVEQLRAGVAQACVVPLMTGLNLQKNSQFLRLGLKYEVLQAAELESNASFAIAPHKAGLKPTLDKALEKIKRNGVYDRVNSLFLPLRID
ncbi:MAG: transporter substrate-binding domain-containing protein [Azonexus sp.]